VHVPRRRGALVPDHQVVTHVNAPVAQVYTGSCTVPVE
jgi:hypothetical protein